MLVLLFRHRVALWLSLILPICLFLAPAASRAQDATGLDAIAAEYHVMIDLFYRPLDPGNMLRVGWNALTDDATRRGVPPPDALPDLPSDTDGALNTFAAAYTAYVANLPPSFSPAMAAADVDNGMADSVHEQHTHYLPPNAMRQFLALVGGGQQNVGIGVRIRGDPPGLIADVAPGGPAQMAGLQPGDVILAADGKDLTAADTGSMDAALAGPEGSTLLLTIDRGAGPQTVEVTRGPYYFPPLESRLLADNIGYVRLVDFVISGTTLPNGSEILADLDRRLDELDAQGAQGLVLDLRNNSGGSVQTADEILGRFLPDTVRSVREADQRGHQSYELAAGRTRSRQLPMAVLINGGSASASEVTAAALHDAHRAVLVGQKTAGAVASSELLPLPGGGGLQVAVATAEAPDSNTPLDGVGVMPDVASSAVRTLADYRAGRDPQLDVAVGALATAPSPPAVAVTLPPISTADLDQLLGAALPASTDLPTNDRFAVTDEWQRLDYTHPNELIDQNGGAADPLALQQIMRIRGYQGSVSASYGATPGYLPAVNVNVDIYAASDGAHNAASTNDLTQIQTSVDAPIQLGDETVSYRGTWLATGSNTVVWRHGRAVFTVTYSDVPGFERPETLTAIAQLVDARAVQLSLP